MARPARSLRSRALQLLAQREQSRTELRRKLLVHARADEAAEPSTEPLEGGPVDTAPHAGPRHPAPAADHAAGSASDRVEAVLTWLDAHQYLSDARFAESRVNARSGRYGNRRIFQELKQHGVTLPVDTVQTLRDTEYLRALAVWERRYAQSPDSLAERGRQSRFLAARGFSSEIVARVLRARRDAAGKMSKEGDDL